MQAGTEETWVYPSQQMFFNALLRKGETQTGFEDHSNSFLGWEFEEGSLAQEDMEHIIKIHNANNESAWQEVTFTIPTFLDLFAICVPVNASYQSNL